MILLLLQSIWKSKHKDRRWYIKCREAGLGDLQQCAWGTYNEWDKPVDFECSQKGGKGPGVITATYSEHSNWREDRQWVFQCCHTSRFRHCYKDCYWTGSVNEWYGAMNYVVPRGRYLVGVRSQHNNDSESVHCPMINVEHFRMLLRSPWFQGQALAVQDLQDRHVLREKRPKDAEDEITNETTDD